MSELDSIKERIGPADAEEIVYDILPRLVQVADDLRAENERLGRVLRVVTAAKDRQFGQRATAEARVAALETTLANVQDKASLVVTAWDDFESCEPCRDCLRSGVALITAASDAQMDAATDDLRRVLDADGVDTTTTDGSGR